MYHLVYLAGLAAILSACAHQQQVSKFQPVENQDAIVRDGVPALVSRKPGSVVLVRQASRIGNPTPNRAVYVIGILNLKEEPVTFYFSDLNIAQTRQGAPVKALKTYSYEALVKEERNRQVGIALLTGLAAGANSMAAANSGYYSGSGTVTSPYGTSHVTYSGYNQAAANAAQLSASIQNERMMSAAIEQGRQNLDALEQGIIKDNTMLPGEWYGGQVHFDSAKGEPPRTYQMTIKVGDDRHVVSFSQVRA